MFGVRATLFIEYIQYWGIEWHSGLVICLVGDRFCFLRWFAVCGIQLSSCISAGCGPLSSQRPGLCGSTPYCCNSVEMMLLEGSLMGGLIPQAEQIVLIPEMHWKNKNKNKKVSQNPGRERYKWLKREKQNKTKNNKMVGKEICLISRWIKLLFRMKTIKLLPPLNGEELTS